LQIYATYVSYLITNDVRLLFLVRWFRSSLGAVAIGAAPGMSIGTVLHADRMVKVITSVLQRTTVKSARKQARERKELEKLKYSSPSYHTLEEKLVLLLIK
jgi:hypothetical protein